MEEKEDYWGLLTSINLYECSLELITNKDFIIQTTIELCSLIDMKRFGECQVIHFGEDKRVEGFSMYQLIETSNLSAHFSNESKAVYFDVFSCKKYDPKIVLQFLVEKFKADSATMNVLERP